MYEAGEYWWCWWPKSNIDFHSLYRQIDTRPRQLTPASSRRMQYFAVEMGVLSKFDRLRNQTLALRCEVRNFADTHSRSHSCSGIPNSVIDYSLQVVTENFQARRKMEKGEVHIVRRPEVGFRHRPALVYNIARDCSLSRKVDTAFKPIIHNYMHR